jgi:Flp pilus assembly protein TadG
VTPAVRRRRQRGQVIPLAAILATVLIGGVALATDLSLQTHFRRNLQNASDAAALAGASDLGPSPSQAQRITAATDALHVVYDHLGWGRYGPGQTWATSAVAAQSATTCSTDVSATRCDVTVAGPDPNVTVTVDIPPRSARNAAYNSIWGYVDTDVTQRSPGQFSPVIGIPSAVSGGHSIAYHYPGQQPFGFALYSNTVITTGNALELVRGNVYAYRSIQPQSSGQAAFCADDTLSGHSSIVLGAPQALPYPSPDPAPGQPFQYLVVPVTKVTDCSVVTGGSVSQTAAVNSCASLSVQGVTMSTTPDPLSHACVANPPLLPPDLQAPTVTGATRKDGSSLGSGQSVLTVTSPLAAGVYDIIHNPLCSPPSCYDVTIDGLSAPSNCAAPYSLSYTTCLLGVTFYLEGGATIGVINKASALFTPYQPPAGTTSNPNDGYFPLYAPPSSAAGVYVTNTSTQLVMTGTVYMPSGTFRVSQNALLSIQGQVIVNRWDVQSGNHTNPEITYDPARVASERETRLLVE